MKNNFIKELLSFNGVELVLLSKNFLSVKKNKSVSWDTLKPIVISHINDYFENHDTPILIKETDKEKDINDSGETVKQILDVLDTKVRPAVARDGGDIKFKSFKDGVVRVELQGSCSGCPSSLMTLKQGVQNLLCHYVKEVKSVEAIKMKKNISYRDKLLELAQIYKVQEILNYKKNKKYLTTSQIEHLLKKNNVPIPTEINKVYWKYIQKKLLNQSALLGKPSLIFLNQALKDL